MQILAGRRTGEATTPPFGGLTRDTLKDARTGVL